MMSIRLLMVLQDTRVYTQNVYSLVNNVVIHGLCICYVLEDYFVEENFV